MPDFPAPTWIERHTTNRAAVNKENAQHSTGPHTPAGKLRSSLNALTHGLTGRTVLCLLKILPPTSSTPGNSSMSTNPKAPPKDSSFRSSSTPPGGSTASRRWKPKYSRAPPIRPPPKPPSNFDIVDAHQAIDKLALYSHRLSRQFHKTLDQLRDIQAERRETETRDLKRAAALLEMHKIKGIPYDPTQDGFVFSKDQIETFSHRLIHLNESRHIEHIRFYAPVGRYAT